MSLLLPPLLICRRKYSTSHMTQIKNDRQAEKFIFSCSGDRCLSYKHWSCIVALSVLVYSCWFRTVQCVCVCVLPPVEHDQGEEAMTTVWTIRMSFNLYCDMRKPRGAVKSHGAISEVKPVLVVQMEALTGLMLCVQEPPELLRSVSRWGSKLHFPNMRSISTTRCCAWPCAGLPAGSLRCPVVSMRERTHKHTHKHKWKEYENVMLVKYS